MGYQKIHSNIFTVHKFINLVSNCLRHQLSISVIIEIMVKCSSCKDHGKLTTVVGVIIPLQIVLIPSMKTTRETNCKKIIIFKFLHRHPNIYICNYLTNSLLSPSGCDSCPKSRGVCDICRSENHFMGFLQNISKSYLLGHGPKTKLFETWLKI